MCQKYLTGSRPPSLKEFLNAAAFIAACHCFCWHRQQLCAISTSPHTNSVPNCRLHRPSDVWGLRLFNLSLTHSTGQSVEFYGLPPSTVRLLGWGMRCTQRSVGDSELEEGSLLASDTYTQSRMKTKQDFLIIQRPHHPHHSPSGCCRCILATAPWKRVHTSLHLLMRTLENL